jgi:hypothetical protein
VVGFFSQSGTFLTPPRVRSRERMEGRRPGVREGAGRRPTSPRAPERRGRGPPGALGSPAAFPSDMMPGRKGATKSLQSSNAPKPGRNPTHVASHPLPRSAWRARRLSSSPSHVARLPRPLPPLEFLARSWPSPQIPVLGTRGWDVPGRWFHTTRHDFTPEATRHRPSASAPNGSLRGKARALPSCRGAEVTSGGGATA